MTGLAGCLGDNGDSPEDVVEEFVDRIDDGDHNGVNELIADDGEMDPWTAEDAAFLEAVDVELTNLEIDEESDSQVFAATTIRMEHGDTLETETTEYELRDVDGDWRFWDSDGE